MEELGGKVAVVTGAASGIGRGMAEALGAAGVKIVLADVDAGALEKTEAELRTGGLDVHRVVTDVSKPESVEALADAAFRHYGKVHILCNNAGIALGRGMLWENTVDDWKWISGVNLDSVFYGVRTFLPRMIEQGEGGHVVNTASLAGLIAGADSGLYTATKFGVVAFSETLQLQLQLTHPSISAHVLCPAWVNTNIMDSERLRPGGARTAPELDARTNVIREWVKEQIDEGLAPRAVGDQVVDAIRQKRFYILTHPSWTPLVAARHQRIVAGENPQMVMTPGSESLFRRLSELA